MAYDKVNYADVDPGAGGTMHFLRGALNCEELGLTVAEYPPGWTGTEHEHADNDHEEVYLLLDGEATVTVDGEDVPLDAGDALRVDPASSRQIQNGDAESTFVIVGAP